MKFDERIHTWEDIEGLLQCPICGFGLKEIQPESTSRGVPRGITFICGAGYIHDEKEWSPAADEICCYAHDLALKQVRGEE